MACIKQHTHFISNESVNIMEIFFSGYSMASILFGNSSDIRSMSLITTYYIFRIKAQPLSSSSKVFYHVITVRVSIPGKIKAGNISGAYTTETCRKHMCNNSQVGNCLKLQTWEFLIFYRYSFIVFIS